MTPTSGAVERVAPCDCIKRLDEFLLRRNTQLVVDMFTDGTRPESIALRTQLIVKKRGARPVRILASYCPICGVPYPSSPAEGQSAGEGGTP